MIANDFIDLGSKLRDALAAGQAEFDKLARASGLKHRKAYYLVAIADAFGNSAISRKDLLSVGWTKLEMLKDRSRDPALAQLVQQAKALPVPELRRLLSGEAPRTKKHIVSLNLTPEQYDVLSRVLVAHGGIKTGRTIAGRETALISALSKLLSPDT